MSFYVDLKNLLLGKKKGRKTFASPKPKPIKDQVYDSYVESLNNLKVSDIDLVDKEKKAIVHYKIGKIWMPSDAFLNILSWLNGPSLLRATEVSRHFFLAANTNHLWDALDGLYDYETKQSKIHFSMGRLDYRTRHKSIVLKSEEKEAFRKKICRWEQQENFEKRSHVRDSDLENIRYAKDLVFGRKGRKK
jgi:hypothetical protein